MVSLGVSAEERDPSVGMLLLFHAGLVSALLGLGWHLSVGESHSEWEHWGKVGLAIAGSAAAWLGWVGSSAWSKSARLGVASCGVLLIALWAYSDTLEFESAPNVWTSWSLDGTELSHPGIGITVPNIPNWEINADPVPLTSTTAAVDPTKSRRGRIWPGETVVLLRMQGPVGAKTNRRGRLSVACTPKVFHSAANVLISVRQDEKAAVRNGGATLLQAARVIEGPLGDVAECEYQDPQGNAHGLYLLRCDSLAVMVSTIAATPEDQVLLRGFVQQIAFRGNHRTRFNQ